MIRAVEKIRENKTEITYALITLLIVAAIAPFVAEPLFQWVVGQFAQGIQYLFNNAK